MTDRDLIDDLVSALNARLIHFSDWEEEFIESISERTVLTEKQLTQAKRIWEKL